MPEQNKKYKKRLLCKVCQTETWHLVLTEFETRQDDDFNGIWIIDRTYTVQCCGCDNICLLKVNVSSEDWNPETNELEEKEFIYPTPQKTREPLNGHYWCPQKVQDAYLECVQAFNDPKMPLLTAIGIRMTLESICLEREIKGKDLWAKIEKMVELTVITRDEAKLLHFIRDYGNLSAHEMQKHQHHELQLCLDIVEGIIKTLWIFPTEAERMKYCGLGKGV